MDGNSRIVRNDRRRLMVAADPDRRSTLQVLIAAPGTAPATSAAARVAQQRFSPDASPARLRNRDASDGRPRGHLHRLALSRITFRGTAHRGELPGVRKCSW
ncbi:30S ribosomal protein S14 [Nakamurella deserti]|uniref:30S ribosomal protein S14 n=1 Tax=Nakamurella deserti TaxID=2164074 RepID=UPI000DBE97DC